MKYMNATNKKISIDYKQKLNEETDEEDEDL